MSMTELKKMLSARGYDLYQEQQAAEHGDEKAGLQWDTSTTRHYMNYRKRTITTEH